MGVGQQISVARLQRVVIVEDEPLFCEAICQLCEEQGRMIVVATVGSGAEASVVMAKEDPDLVILDLGLPDLDGFSLMHQCHDRSSRIRFLIVTACSDDYTLFRLSRAGVRGMVDKRADDFTALRSAIQIVGNGGTSFSNRYTEAIRRREELGDRPGSHLTERERAVLVLAGLGLSNQEIGDRLGISSVTAERHRNTLFRKLDVRRTPKLMELARKGGFTQIPTSGDGPPVYP